MTAADMTLDEAVARAIREHEEYVRRAAPSIRKVEPRVYVSIDMFEGLRRPFKHKGRWAVRARGVAYLVAPRIQGAEVVFDLDWQ